MVTDYQGRNLLHLKIIFNFFNWSVQALLCYSWHSWNRQFVVDHEKCNDVNESKFLEGSLNDCNFDEGSIIVGQLIAKSFLINLTFLFYVLNFTLSCFSLWFMSFFCAKDCFRITIYFFTQRNWISYHKFLMIDTNKTKNNSETKIGSASHYYL